jgi:hypothetical protein
VLEQMQHDREAKQVRDRSSNPLSQAPVQEQPPSPEVVEATEPRRRRKPRLCEVRDGKF